MRRLWNKLPCVRFSVDKLMYFKIIFSLLIQYSLTFLHGLTQGFLIKTDIIAFMAQNPYDTFSHLPSWISTLCIKVKENLKKLVSLCLWLMVFTSRLQIQLICRRVLFSIRGRDLGSCRTLKKKALLLETAIRIVQRDVKNKSGTFPMLTWTNSLQSSRK